MAVLRVQAPADELGVVLLDVAHLGILEQLVALVHFNAKAVQRGHHLLRVGDDRFALARQLGQEVPLDLVEEGELHLLRIHQHELDLARVLLVKERDEDRVQAHRFPLARGTGHQQVGHLRKIRHEGLVADGLAQYDGQIIFAVLELLAGHHGAHAHDLRIAVGHFDADGALAGDRRDNADAQCRQAQGDVVLQVLDLADAHPGLRHDLVQRHRRPDGGLDLFDADVVVVQRGDDLVLVLLQLLLGHGELAGAVLGQQVQGRRDVAAEVQRGVIFPEFLQLGLDLRLTQGFLLHRRFHTEAVLLVVDAAQVGVPAHGCRVQLRFFRLLDHLIFSGRFHLQLQVSFSSGFGDHGFHHGHVGIVQVRLLHPVPTHLGPTVHAFGFRCFHVCLRFALEQGHHPVQGRIEGEYHEGCGREENGRTRAEGA